VQVGVGSQSVDNIVGAMFNKRNLTLEAQMAAEAKKTSMAEKHAQLAEEGQAAASSSASGAARVSGWVPPTPKCQPPRAADSAQQAIGARLGKPHDLLVEDISRMQELNEVRHMELDPVLIISIQDDRLDEIVKKGDDNMVRDYGMIQGAYFGTPIHLNGCPVYKQTSVGADEPQSQLYLWKAEHGWFVGEYVYQNERSRAAFVKQHGKEPGDIIWLKGNEAIPAGPAHYPFWSKTADHSIKVCALWEYCLDKDKKMEDQVCTISVLEGQLAECQAALDAVAVADVQTAQEAHDGAAGGGRAHPYGDKTGLKPKRGGWITKTAQLASDFLNENYGACRWRIDKFKSESETFEDELNKLERHGSWNSYGKW
jgi:hypothetical protein